MDMRGCRYMYIQCTCTCIYSVHVHVYTVYMYMCIKCVRCECVGICVSVLSVYTTQKISFHKHQYWNYEV